MNRRAAVCCVLAAAAGVFADRPASGFGKLLPLCTDRTLDKLNARLAGRVLDFTANHGPDNRVYSPALGAKRDLYVYLPPGYDGTTRFPLIIWMHGFRQSEENFLDIVQLFDAGVRCGNMPPCVVVAVDGSTKGRPGLGNTGSFYMNGPFGRFEDYVTDDVYEFAHRTFALLPDRSANCLSGASMGGYGAYHLGFKHREKFGLLAGFIPALDIRYADCHDRYFRNFDPNCFMERDHYRPFRTIARYFGVVPVKERRVVLAALGKRPPDGLRPLAERNPVEQLENLNIQPGEFGMFVGYVGKDEFNLDAGAEHFLHAAARRGITVDAHFLPTGHHDTGSAKQFFPAYCRWLTGQLGGHIAPAPLCGDCGDFDRLLRGRPSLVWALRGGRPHPGQVVSGNPFAPAGVGP